MLDLSEESKEDNIADCVKYFTRMAKINCMSPSIVSHPTNASNYFLSPSNTFNTKPNSNANANQPQLVWLEMEIGITGGEEDGVDNSAVDNASLYTQPEDIWDVYSALSKISPNFSIAAGFGNVHGVYKPGNVVLRPELLGMHQKHAAEKLGQSGKPL